ncbi:MAG: glycosyltransferase [Pirellulaceae bacterium]
MKIACTIHSLRGGGAERVMAALASRVAKDHDVTLITLDRAANDRYPCEAAVRRVGLDVLADSRSSIDAVVQNRRRIIKLRQAIIDASPDVVLSFCDRMNIVALAACKPLRIPVVVSERTQPAYQHIGPSWSLLRRWYYRSAAAVVVQTQAAGTTVAKWTRSPIVVIPAAIDPPPPDVIGRGVAAETRTLVSVGRLSPEKQVDRLIDAFAALPPELNPWRLKIYGEGVCRVTLQDQIDRRQVGDRVQLLPWVQDVWSIFETSRSVCIDQSIRRFQRVAGSDGGGSPLFVRRLR